MTTPIVIEFDCLDCGDGVTIAFRENKPRMSKVVECNCCELYAVIVEDDEITIHETGPEISPKIITNLRENPCESELEVFENPLPDRCDVCGLTYKDFPSGETFASIIENYLWSASDDPENWPYKNRASVLGKWHEVKQMQWQHHLDQCESGEDDEPREEIEEDFEY